MSMEFQFCKVKTILGMDGGAGCITACNSAPLHCGRTIVPTRHVVTRILQQ